MLPLSNIIFTVICYALLLLIFYRGYKGFRDKEMNLRRLFKDNIVKGERAQIFGIFFMLLTGGVLIFLTYAIITTYL